jgi:hypothetical protein
MAYEGHLLPMCHQLRPSPQRIQAAGEQNDFVGRKFYIIPSSRQREIGLDRGLSFESRRNSNS